jgi:peptidoglycan/xylan/chitin deacetylase (PgdA/CDA1 family)
MDIHIYAYVYIYIYMLLSILLLSSSLILIIILLFKGHEIANHIWDHRVLTQIPIDSVYEQLQRTNTAIKKILNIEPKVMRPPYGNTNARLNNLIQNKGDFDDYLRLIMEYVVIVYLNIDVYIIYIHICIFIYM